MEKEHKLLTTKEFADRTGIAVDVVSRWVRSGKIKALKQSGRWLIAPSQLKLKAVQQAASDRPASQQKKRQPDSGPVSARKIDSVGPELPIPSKATAASYSVAEFAEMSYLTERGVLLWLKEGRLRGIKDDAKQWRILADNLEDPNVKRLLR
jgi:excisionase family DNA binding protein